MQKIFGMSPATLTGYFSFFSIFFGSLSATAMANVTWPKWIAIGCGVLFAVAGAGRIAIGHLTNDAPDQPPPAK